MKSSRVFLLLLPHFAQSTEVAPQEPEFIRIVDHDIDVADVMVGADGSTKSARNRALMRSEGGRDVQESGRGMYEAQEVVYSEQTPTTTPAESDPRYHQGCLSSDWGPWGDWSACPYNCNPPSSVGLAQPTPGVRQQMRVALGGLSCLAVDAVSQTEICIETMAPCPQNCRWHDWLPWGSCTATCGGGKMTRKRHHRQYAANGGVDCVGNVTDTADCNIQACVNNCTFSAWTAWPTCSASCGITVQMLLRQRNVTYISQSAPDVSNCAGQTEVDGTICGVPPCTKNCTWSGYGAWGECRCPSNSTEGTQTETQTVAEAGMGAGQFCKGPLVLSGNCTCSQSSLMDYDYDINEEREARAEYALQQEQEEMASISHVKHVRADPNRKPQISLATDEDMYAALPRQSAQGSMASLLEEDSLPSMSTNQHKYLQGTVLGVEAKVHQGSAAGVNQANKVQNVSQPKGAANLAERSISAASQDPNGATNIVAIVVISLAILCIAAACLLMSLTVHGAKQARTPDRRSDDLNDSIARIRETRPTRSLNRQPQ